MDWGGDDIETDIDGEEYTDPAAHRPERRSQRWYQHPSIRLSEILTLVGMLCAFILFARSYDNRLVVVEERQGVVREQLRIMQEQPGNSLTQPSRYSLERFHEQNEHLERIDRMIEYQRNYVLKLEERVNELYYTHRQDRHEQ